MAKRNVMYEDDNSNAFFFTYPLLYKLFSYLVYNSETFRNHLIILGRIKEYDKVERHVQEWKLSPFLFSRYVFFYIDFFRFQAVIRKSFEII